MDSSTTHNNQLSVEVFACLSCRSTDTYPTGSEVSGFSVTTDGKEFRQADYSIRECGNCGLLYKTRFLPTEDLNDYYARVDFRKWEISGLFPTERLTMKVLRSLPSKSRILDFGCSSGRLLAPLVDEYECWGFEINTTAAEDARKRGLKILSESELAELASNSFSAVVMVDVFEHLNSPTETLTKLWTLVQPGGWLLLVTGNADSPACRRDPAQFWYFRSVEHLCMLTRRYCNFLANKLDAKLSFWETVCHYDTPILERIRQQTQQFAYWQYRRGTFLAQIILPFVPMLSRAGQWQVAPGFNCSRDHVLAGFQKQSL